jgi:hypothetical protein
MYSIVISLYIFGGDCLDVFFELDNFLRVGSWRSRAEGFVVEVFSAVGATASSESPPDLREPDKTSSSSYKAAYGFVGARLRLLMHMRLPPGGVRLVLGGVGPRKASSATLFGVGIPGAV